MPVSQNGLSAGDPSLIHSVLVPGTDVKLTVRKGPVGDLLIYAAARFHREVEPLRANDGVLDCWGYAYRDIAGSSNQLSNHASGSAIDLRARAHPLATTVASTFTAAQAAACRRIMADCAPCLRWGGSYTGRIDSMHWETLGTEADVAAVLSKVNGAGGMSPNTAQQVDEIHEQVTGVLKAWAGGITDDKNTPYNLLQHLLRVSVTTNQCALMLQKLSQQRQVQLHDTTVERIVEGVHERTADVVADITHRAVSDEMATSGFWKATAERMLRAFAATLLPLLGAGSVSILDVPWETALGVSGTAAVVSLLASLVASQTGTKGTPSFLRGGD